MADLDIGGAADAGVMDEASEPTTITHRRGQTRYLNRVPKAGDPPRRRCGGHALPTGLRTGQAERRRARSPTKRWKGCLKGPKSTPGPCLLAPRDKTGRSRRPTLEVVATRTDVEPRYHRVSGFLANTVLREGEAVLARNVLDDSMLGTRDSKGEIHSTSVICAPIREGNNRAIGLIHLYSTVDDRQPDPDDLEFTLAVADNVALAINNLERQRELAENLSRTRSEIQQLRIAAGRRKRDCRQQHADGERPAGDCPSSGQPRDGADSRRIGRRQGTGGSRRALCLAAKERALRLSQLRGADRIAAGK